MAAMVGHVGGGASFLSNLDMNVGSIATRRYLLGDAVLRVIRTFSSVRASACSATGGNPVFDVRRFAISRK